VRVRMRVACVVGSGVGCAYRTREILGSGSAKLPQARIDNLDQVVISVDDVPLRVDPRPVLAVEIAASQLEGAKQCLVTRTGH
jgi:hypothetical protein